MSSNWTSLLIFLLCFIVFIIIAVSYAEASRKSKKLLRDYEELKERLAQTNQELQKKSRQISTLSMQLATFDENVEKFIKSTSQNKKDVNELKIEIRQFHRSIRNVKHSLESLKLYFENIDPRFFRELEEKYPEISLKDKKICAFIRLNMNNKEISKVMNITTGGVYQSKRRLKKKLGLGPEDKLKKFIHSVANSETVVSN